MKRPRRMTKKKTTQRIHARVKKDLNKISRHAERADLQIMEARYSSRFFRKNNRDDMDCISRFTQQIDYRLAAQKGGNKFHKRVRDLDSV